jgi:hypothetical protein
MTLIEVKYTIQQSLAEFEYVIQCITEAIASNLLLVVRIFWKN